MEERKDEASKLTKVLINKLHGDRKNINFFNDTISLDKKTLHEDSNRTRRNKKKKPINPIYGHIFRICGIIIILGYLINVYIDHKKSNNIKIIAAPKIQEHDYSKNKTQSEPSYQRGTNHISNKNNIVKPTSTEVEATITNPSHKNCNIQNISLTGKVFSWTDKNGLKHYSNTNYPQNNPTLKVQTEIKTENSATKISIQNGQIFIPVTLINNGKQITISMVLDTGCSRTNIPYKYLNQLSATYTQDTTSIVANGSMSYGRLTNVEMIKVGPNQEYNFNINGSEVAGSQNKGLLGLDFLKKHPFKIDFDNEFIVWD